MHALDLIPRHWLDRDPHCNTGIEEAFALATGGAALIDASGGAGLLTEVTSAGVSGGLGLGEIGTVASVAGTGISALSGMSQAQYQQLVAKREAEALKQKANENAAAAQRVQITRERQTALALSRGQALAAASGGGATDPTVLNIQSDIAGQGEYNALTALYEGQSRARSDQYQADIDLFRAKRIQAGAPLAATGTILGGVANFADRVARRRRDYLLSQYGDY
jgi:hypothetical protein